MNAQPAGWPLVVPATGWVAIWLCWSAAAFAATLLTTGQMGP